MKPSYQLLPLGTPFYLEDLLELFVDVPYISLVSIDEINEKLPLLILYYGVDLDGGSGAEVVEGGIDELALEDFFHIFLGNGTHAVVFNVEAAAVGEADTVAGGKLTLTVGTDDLAVDGAGEKGAFNGIAMDINTGNGAAGNNDQLTAAILAVLTHNDGGIDCCADTEQ